MIRNQNDLLLHLISNCKTNEAKKQMATLITNFFFENILSISYVEDSLLVVIYLILEKDIAELTTISKDIMDKKDDDLNFAKLLIQLLGQKEDIKSYFSLVLNDLIFEIEKEDSILKINIDEIAQELLGNQKNELIVTASTLDEDDFIIKRHTRCEDFKEELNLYKEKMILSNGPQRFENEEDNDYNNITNIKSEKKLQIIDIDQNYLNEKYQNETNPTMKQYLLNQINKIDKFDKKSDHFMNNEFFRRLKLKEPNSRRIFITYNYHCIKLKWYMNKIINTLLAYLPVIPKSIKMICRMIAMLLKKKYPQITILEQNIYITKYFFGQLFLPFFQHPSSNGLFSTTILSFSTKQTIKLLITLITRLLQGKLFTCKYYYFTTFNSYFIELMPLFITFFEKLIQVKLPSVIEKMFNDKDNPNRNINYSYLTENKGEELEHQSICLNWSDINFIFDVVKDNPTIFNQPQYSVLQTHYRKLSFHFEKYKKYYNEDQKNLKKTFILLTNINYDPVFKEKLNFQIEQKISFQAIEGEDSTLLILPRIKYCFRKILGSLHTLSKEDFSFFLSIEDIVDLLNRMLELEELSGSSYDCSIPLTWYGLYLKTNLNLLPNEYKNNNYTKLFQEMIQETEQCFKEFDTTVLNKLRIKTKYLAKKNRSINTNLYKLKQIEKYINMQNFVSRAIIPICLCAVQSNKEHKHWELFKIGSCPHDKINYLNSVLFSKQKSKIDAQDNHLNTIREFINKFPSIKEEFDLCFCQDLTFYEYQDKLNIPEVIRQYYSVLLEHLKADVAFSQYSQAELNAVLYELTSYIISKIYKKLYSEFPSKDDVICFNNCFEMEWIQPFHLIKDKKVVDENLWKTATKFLNQMDREKSPLTKLNAFSQASKIIHNSITFCSGKKELGVDDSINVFLYVVLKSKPKRLMSNLHFTKLYLNKDLEKKDKGMLMVELNLIADFLRNANHKMVDGMSEEEFQK